jgi:hypothetical protein
MALAFIFVIVPLSDRFDKQTRLQSNHISSGLSGVFARFQNRDGANTLRGNPRLQESPMQANRNLLYLVIGALIVVVGVLGYNLYQTKKEPEGLQINVGPNGLKIQNK